MIHVPGAGFCDDQLPVLSTIGRGPVGPEGPKGDKGDPVEPTFADPLEWDDNRSYAAYTIVLHDGDSYTSKVAVPVGISLDDDDYWVHTGDYNAQVEAYRQEVSMFDQRITDNTNAIKSIRNINNVKGVLFGDSWTLGNGGNALFSYLNNNFGTWVRYGVSGSLFSGIAAQVATAISAMTETQRNEITHVILLSGLNTANNETTFDNAGTSAACDAVRNAFPYAEIHWFPSMSCACVNYMWRYRQIREICESRAIACHMDFAYALLTANRGLYAWTMDEFSKDEYGMNHLSTNGGNFYARNIMQYLTGGTSVPIMSYFDFYLYKEGTDEPLKFRAMCGDRTITIASDYMYHPNTVNQVIFEANQNRVTYRGYKATYDSETKQTCPIYRQGIFTGTSYSYENTGVWASKPLYFEVGTGDINETTFNEPITMAFYNPASDITSRHVFQNYVSIEIPNPFMY